MSAPPAPHLVPGSTVILAAEFRVGTAEAALEHSILYDKSGGRCDKNMEFLMKEKELVTLSLGDVTGLQMSQSTYTKLGGCSHRL